MYLVHQKIWEFKTLVLSLWVKQLYKCEKTNKQTNKQTNRPTNQKLSEILYSENMGNQRKTRK